MNSRQKEILQSELNNEKKTINELKQVYGQAIKDCEQKIRELSMRSDMENLQSIIYQKQYQQAIKGQLEGVLSQLQSNEFATVSEYLNKCYVDGYVGNMYDLAGQGIPLIVPIAQEQVAKVIQIDSKLSKPLYNSLGEDVNKLKTAIRAQVSRGIANGSSWNDIAKTLAETNMKNTPFNKAINRTITIARTEGHRVQTAAKLNSMEDAKKKGADVVKQWDATLDGSTRETHRKLDGQIREVDEDFEVDGMHASAPGHFGDPAEDCNCRCAVLQRAKWALNEAELETLQERAEFFGLDKTDDFNDFKEKYLKAANEESEGADSDSVRSDAQKISNESTSQEKATDKQPTQDELDAVENYVSGDGMYINHYLRDGDEAIKQMGEMRSEDKELIKNLEKATDRTQDNKVLYRSVDASAVFGDISMSDYEALRDKLVYNIDDKSTAKATDLIEAAKGKTITDKGFMSTTKDYEVAADFGDFTGSDKPIIIEFANADKVKGFDLEKHMPELNSNMEQAEVLLHNNSSYVIKDITTKKDDFGTNIYIKAEFENQLENIGNSSTIKSITVDNVRKAIEGSTIKPEVADYVYDTLANKNAARMFDKVRQIEVDPSIVMNTNVDRAGTFADVVLELNTNALGGKTIAEIDSMFMNAKNTVANSFEDAIAHEKYHADLIRGKNYAEIESLYDKLGYVHIESLSKTAYKDGTECIAEVGVMIDRGDAEKVPKDAMDLFVEYMGNRL